MANKKKKKIVYTLDDKLIYAAGGLWEMGTLNSNPYAPIGQVANMAGTMGAGILDNAIPDQHQRINVGKETSMGMLKGAGQGAALGANPMLAAATGGLSIAAGAVIGGAAGGLISHKNAKKNAQANHDALIGQYYGNNPTTFAYGGNLGGDPKKTPEYKKYLQDMQMYKDSLTLSENLLLYEEPRKRNQVPRIRDANEIDLYKANPPSNTTYNRQSDNDLYEIINRLKDKNGRFPGTAHEKRNPEINGITTAVVFDPPKVKPKFTGQKYIEEFNPKTADRLESRSPNMLDNDLPIRENDFQMDYSLPNMPKMDKFYVGMDDKNEKLRQQGKAYYTQNSQGHKVFIPSGDLNRNKPSEGIRDGGSQRIGYDRGNASMYADGGQMNNNPNQFGNQMSVFQGNKHEEGGIQLGMNSEVEAGEVKWKDYIFSDQLTPEGSKETFARKAKRIKSKFKGRENDVKANEVLESELSKLAAQNDMEIEKKTTELNKFRNGGRLKYANGGNPWEFQQFEDAPIDVNSLGSFRGSTANYGIGDFNYVDDRLYTETPGANDYPVFKNSGNYPIKPKTGSYSSVNYNTDTIIPHNISQGRTLSEPSRDRSKDYLRQLGINDPTQPRYIPSFNPFEGSDQTYDFNDVTLPSPIKSKFEPTVKRSDQLPQRQLDPTQTATEDLSKYDDFLNQEALKDRNNFGYAEAGLLASNMAGVDNLIKSMKPAQTKFDRVKLDRLDLSTARDLNARNSALGQRISQANVRNNATSSGQALSTLSASNSALTNQRINADLSTMLQEEQANNQITNQERSVNNQISREEYIANEQNRATAQSTGNASLASLGNNFNAYARDKVLTKADVLSNKRMMDVLNNIAPNYQWNISQEDDSMMLRYISKLSQ